jgi:predicted homoserine dehydrogenase-like protein
VQARGLPLGLAHGVKLVRDIAAGALVRWDDVAFDAHDDAVLLRREMEASLRRMSPMETVEAAAPHQVT